MIDHLVEKLVLLSLSCQMYFDSSVLLESFLWVNWYSDIPNKNRHTFAVFDIESFYPSITEKLLTDSIKGQLSDR